MISELSVYWIVAALWLLAALHAAYSFWDGLKFNRFVGDALRRDDCVDVKGGDVPRVAVIMPCKGVDEKLHETMRKLAAQTLRPARVIFTLESRNDPAWKALEGWASEWRGLAYEFVEAGLAEHRGQKVHNLLAAEARVGDDIDVVVFLDSDAVPGDDWLAHLVAPLRDERVGVSTGYRWYTAFGGLAAGVRCAWNAATASLLADERLNFCWGGSMALRREAFASMRVRDYWNGALSDDYQLTRAVRDAGLTIRFVPRAIVASGDRTTLSGFLEFARRQMIITRICHPALWMSGFMLIVNLTIGGLAVAGLTIAGLAGWYGTRTAGWLALAGWLVIMALAGARAVARQVALRRLLSPPDLTWRDFAWDVGSTLSFGGGLHMNLFMASIGKRRIWWRDTQYEMVSPAETRIVSRR
ncbi:MAG TPA: glycosyltransferase [Phycisphaerae bacterium]|nr:glycosyltransferase [Phycisphaerae bacterium]HRW54005.1 glycosyltransferase [Phycisphaerae bacterium]